MTIGFKANNDGSGVIQVNGVDRATVDASGNVGVGTTPLKKFDVKYEGAGSGGVYVVRNNSINLLANINGTTAAEFGTETNHPLRFLVNNTERGGFDTSGNFQFNSGFGSVATTFGCRAWVNFNGTGTVAIRASGNVSSITDGGVGVYTVNFTNSMPDANYSGQVSVSDANRPGVNSGATASGFGVTARNNANTLIDLDTIHVAIFR